jgi:UDP-N-acetylglucosamine--N-acetylmuramyl-(pentapeptide) pyrophosphoryl-undecaprenol N-acetylglucosamine transferase
MVSPNPVSPVPVSLDDPAWPAVRSQPAPRTLLVATAGGHLDELKLLVRELDIDVRNAVWVTSRSAQTEELLAEDDVVWVPPVGSGHRIRAASRLPMAMRVHRRIRPDRVITTGALFSTPHLVAASIAGTPTWFIDSATRVSAPSSTGRFVRRFTKAKLHVQGDGWGDPRWTPVPGVFDSFDVQASDTPPSTIRKAVVALGTEVWPFNRVVERVLELLPDAEITWQAGVTDYVHEGVQLQRWLPPAELRRAMREADVVIAHAGVGTVLAALGESKVPIVLPRLEAQREHVDDHQVEVAAMLDRRSLVVSVDPDALTYDDLVRAAGLESRDRSLTPHPHV